MDHLPGSFASTPSFTTFDSVFSASDLSGPYITPSPSTTPQDWGSDLWALTADLSSHAAAQDVLSFAGSELTSCEDWIIHDGGSEYLGMTTPRTNGLGLEVLDANFGA